MSVLCDRGEYQRVCEFPYFSLLEFVQATLESKAQTQDVVAAAVSDTITFHEAREVHADYADAPQILYSFHVFHENYRVAAAAMHALASRLGHAQQSDTELSLDDRIRLLDLQRNALGTTLNALRLLPSVATAFIELPAVDRELLLLSVQDIQREYALVNARFTLLEAALASTTPSAALQTGWSSQASASSCAHSRSAKRPAGADGCGGVAGWGWPAPRRGVTRRAVCLRAPRGSAGRGGPVARLCLRRHRSGTAAAQRPAPDSCG